MQAPSTNSHRHYRGEVSAVALTNTQCTPNENAGFHHEQTLSLLDLSYHLQWRFRHHHTAPPYSPQAHTMPSMYTLVASYSPLLSNGTSHSAASCF